MPGTCPFVNARGETCGKGFVAGFTHCAHHRARPAPKPSRPCAKCGKPTKRAAGVCLGRSCGWNAYRRELTARKRAAACEQSAEELAASERDRRAEEAAEEVAAAFEELAAALDDATGATPWPEWVGMSRDAFEARGDLESLEAERAAERQRQDAAAAALVAALQVAESEAAAAAERDRAAREQLDRLRRAYAGTLCRSETARSGAASPRNVSPAC